jgi:hypothetical protein
MDHSIRAACIGLSLSGQTGLTWIEAAIQGVLVTGAAVLVKQWVKRVRVRDYDLARSPFMEGGLLWFLGGVT